MMKMSAKFDEYAQNSLVSVMFTMSTHDTLTDEHMKPKQC